MYFNKVLHLLAVINLSVQNAYAQVRISNSNYDFGDFEMNDTSARSLAMDINVSQARLGGPCSYYENRPCTIYGAYCMNEICTCDPYTYIADLSRNECLPKANKTGDPCEVDLQCSATLSGNGKCGPNKVCICSEGSKPNDDGTECLMGDKFSGETCSNSMDCFGYPDKSECLNGACHCKSGFVTSSNKSESRLGCLPVIDRLGRECLDKNQCQQGTLGKGSDCAVPEYYRRYDYKPYFNRKECVCSEDTYEASLVYGESDICYKKADRLGDSCETDLQCQYNLGKESECSPDGECVCSGSATPSEDGMSCLPSGVLIGNPCQFSSQCVGKPNISSTCSESEICLCKAGFVQNANMSDCVPIRKEVGETCVVPWQCDNIGNNVDCSERSSIKKGNGQKVCKCKNGYIKGSGKNKCYKKARDINDRCDIDAQCIPLLKLSRCIDRQCKCISGAEFMYKPGYGSSSRECVLKSDYN